MKAAIRMPYTGSRACTHQRRDEDRGQPISAIFDHPRRHDRRHRAGKRRKERDKRLAAEPDAGHEPIHQERGSGHVSAVFEQGDKEKQHHDLRQKYQHAAHATDHAVDDERAPSPLGQQVLHAPAERIERGGNQVHRRRGHDEDRCKDDQHHEQKEERAEDLVHQHMVDAVAGGDDAPARPRDDVLQHAADPFITGHRFDRRNRAAGRGQSFASGAELAG